MYVCMYIYIYIYIYIIGAVDVQPPGRRTSYRRGEHPAAGAADVPPGRRMSCHDHDFYRLAQVYVDYDL